MVLSSVALIQRPTRVVSAAPFVALSAPLKVPVHEGAGGFTESLQPQGATVVGDAGHEGRSNWSLRRNHAMGVTDRHIGARRTTPGAQRPGATLRESFTRPG